MIQAASSPCLPASVETLGETGVHVWCISLGGGATDPPGYAAVLSEQERERTGRFHFEPDRRRALVSRGALRIILGAYLGIPPESLRFRTSHAGRPELEEDPGDGMLSFNVSHSADLVLIGVARGRLIGVDVEQVREKADIAQIADRFFAPEEAATVRSAPVESRREVFHALWTAKESYLKALGCGLVGGLASFVLSPRPGGWKVIPGAGCDRRAAGEWSIVPLKAGGGYAAAVAVGGGRIDLQVLFCASPPPTAAVQGMIRQSGSVDGSASRETLGHFQ